MEALSKEAEETAAVIAQSAEPVADAFVNEQLKPRAHQSASDLEPQVGHILTFGRSAKNLFLNLKSHQDRYAAPCILQKLYEAADRLQPVTFCLWRCFVGLRSAGWC